LLTQWLIARGDRQLSGKGRESLFPLGGGYIRDCAIKQGMLAYAWFGLTVGGLLILVGLSALYDLLLSDHYIAFVKVTTFLIWFPFAGVLLHGIRAIVLLMMLVLPQWRLVRTSTTYRPSRVLQFLLQPRDADVLVQILIAGLIVWTWWQY
jgi:hypothetical protein